jgi:cell division cycle protein 37
MPIDYSKWDTLELSDDEDFECHPNVDKKSMVRWKQAQVHRERTMLKDQLELLQLEFKQTKKFLEWIPEQLKSIADIKEPEERLKVIDFLVK